MKHSNSPSQRGTNKKSLIEIESPKVPSYFSNGSFSRRIKGRRTSLPTTSSANNAHHTFYSPSFTSSTTNRAVRRVQKVSKRAALASKRKIWDSNDASIDAAQSAVDKWEASYETFRSFLINSTNSALQIYNATKSASQKIENGLFVPIRDVVILPTFLGVEKAVDCTVGFLNSEEAVGIAQNSLYLIKQTPFIGNNILAPALVTSFDFLRTTWEIAKYPIPSRENVRWTVDTMMTGTKWFLLTSSREIYFYAKLVDATVTRTLSHTQWRVLGSGPYSTLDQANKDEVINHLCERYFALKDKIARYELAAHIKYHNSSLYQDLVLMGLLLERGGNKTKHDIWLTPSPEYRMMEDDILFVKTKRNYDRCNIDDNVRSDVKPLWFYHPSQNGNKPGKDTAWICFNKFDQDTIENRFISFLERSPSKNSISKPTSVPASFSTIFEEKKEAIPTTTTTQNNPSIYLDEDNNGYASSSSSLSHWYEPNLSEDVLIEHKRHSVSFLPHCPSCKSIHERINLPPPYVSSNSCSLYGSLCYSCHEQSTDRCDHVEELIFPIKIIMRPTLWRFYGPGNDVRRGVWLMDTQKGLQPYSDSSAAVLEDAYLFLKWRMSSENQNDEEERNGIDSVLLTVQVIGPDGEESQLVQFRSLTKITAIQKTIAGGIALFKRRVYRGAKHISNASQEGFHTEDNGTHVNKANMSHELLAAPSSLLPQSATSLENNLVDNHATAEHLTLVVHGIGEMLRSTELFGLSLPSMTSTIVDCCSSLRKNHEAVLAAHESNCSSKASTGMVEYLPVEWHELFALKSRWSQGDSQGDQQNGQGSRSSPTPATLEDISLSTIPTMREFTNNTMLDILFFMSPNHHDEMVNIVCNEMNTVVQKYRSLTGFDGKVSILAHSLGSVISWDILSRQVSDIEKESESTVLLDDILPNSTASYQGKPEDVIYPKLDFRVSNAFMIGSPLAVFLMMRGQPITQDYCLPGCSRVFNIFHPYDPVAYRIEPLLSRDNALAEPKIITHWKGGFRVQYQTKLLWRMIIDETKRTQKSVAKAVEAGIEGIGLLDKTVDDLMEEEDDDESSILSEDSSFQIVCVGNLNEGKRLDYMLQEKEIENANEYLSALAAHGSYWGERDLSLFIARQIFRSNVDADDGSGVNKVGEDLAPGNSYQQIDEISVV